jgi:hypothetical protein
VKRVDHEAVEKADFVGPDAEPVHAGIDHHVTRPSWRGFFPPRDLSWRVENRPGAAGEGRCHVLRTHTVQDAK